MRKLYDHAISSLLFSISVTTTATHISPDSKGHHGNHRHYSRRHRRAGTNQFHCSILDNVVLIMSPGEDETMLPATIFISPYGHISTNEHNSW